MPNSDSSQPSSRFALLRHALDHATHLLPAQGPIGVFIHHNTLHAFQHLRFEEAVESAARLFGAEPYLPEEQYQAERRRGRILDRDIEAVLSGEPAEALWPGGPSRREIRRVMLTPGVRFFSPDSIEWQLEEGGLLDRFRIDLPPETRRTLSDTPGSSRESVRALLAVCLRRLPARGGIAPPPVVRPRDGVLVATGVDIDELIHPWLIRICSVFLDQGISYWTMPERESGLYGSTCKLLQQGAFLESSGLEGLQQAFAALTRRDLTAEEAVLEYLDHYQVPEGEWEALLTGELLALPGWAGLIRQLEDSPQLAPYEVLPSRLMDFLAVRLTFSRVAAESAWIQAQRVGIRSQDSNPATGWRVSLPPRPATEREQLVDAARLFDAAQLLGLSAARLEQLDSPQFSRFAAEVLEFDEWDRRRTLHLAYERRHAEQVLQPLREFRRTVSPEEPAPRPAAHVIFCIDEREESMRRALEEVDPEVETLGAAGFFGVAVNYRGVDDAHGVSLCPIVVTPQHAVIETVRGEDSALLQRRKERRRAWSELYRLTQIGSRTLVRGWIGTIGLGLFSLVPLLTRVLSPRTAGRAYAWLNERLLPQPRTELTLMRQDAHGDHVTEGLLLGFAVEEKAERVASVLRPAGLLGGHARLVVVLGHGSTSLNNPHESAHDCGACGGRRGGPNARLFAAMANHPEVRTLLASRHDVVIPEDTWFVGGYHDTCSDAVELFDTEDVPDGHREDLARVRRSLDEARAIDALERARRFEAAAGDVTPEQALRHVEERSEHLAEPRPEYGHATNAVAIVGRRSLTRGLFLDRRAFLISYDATRDADDSSLAALLAAVGPVCGGINLEYYFSTVDNEHYGCGTKLPHNVTGLIGVMNGPSSDLRTGLPWQMVEVHEPVRLLLLVETTPARLGCTMNGNPGFKELVENAWIRVATMDPETGDIHVYRADGPGAGFVPLEDTPASLPQAPTSVDWFRGHLDHLPLARIGRQPAAAMPRTFRRQRVAA